jgi:hypothetical protein
MQMNIDPTRKYSLQEIVDLELIPNITGYTAIYNRVHYKDDEDVRHLHRKTTQFNLKADHEGAPGNKIHGRISVLGSEIITFLKLNGHYKDVE